jgi:hypothetical protein
MLTNLYTSHSRARAVNMWIALTTMMKLHLSVTDYYSKMCQYADDLIATGAPSTTMSLLLIFLLILMKITI